MRVRSARRALLALQDAERVLALARDRATRTSLIQAIAARHAASQAQATAAITDRYARQIAALAASTPRHELSAALERLKREEAGELSQHFLAGSSRLEEEQRAVTAAFRTTTRALRRDRSLRHRRERAHLAIVLRPCGVRSDAPRRFSSKIARRLPLKLARQRAPAPKI